MEKSGSKQDLDINEANGSANKEPETTPATYKKLPDEDANWQSKNEEAKKENENLPNTMDSTVVKENGVEPEISDEAPEKMNQEDVKLTPKKEPTEVKFISGNGDTKINIETVKQVLSGMGKEELMEFANDPFWVRLRWILFIAFWVLWVGMLAGAIAIIIMAPKCSSPEPKKWWQKSPIIHLDASDISTHNLKGLKTLLDSIKEQNIKTISLAPIFHKDINGHTIDFRDIDPSLGSEADLKEFIEAANARGQHVILEMDPNHSSDQHDWFKRSVRREDNYTSYYVWADGKLENGVRHPPNNWLTVYGDSAWEWNAERGQYYLHQFNKSQPELNFNNTAVVNHFENIFTHWLEFGIEGFRLENTQFLTEDPKLENEKTLPSATPGSYDSLSHVKTRERVENEVILRKWRDIVLNATKGEGLFSLSDDIGADVLQVYNDQKTGHRLIDLPQNSQFLYNTDIKLSAETLKKNISQILNVYEWPSWNLNGKRRTLQSRDPSEANSLTLMILLLPGTPVYNYPDVVSVKDAFSIVSKKRNDQAFLYGETRIYVIPHSEVFVYTRIRSGTPGFLVAFNVANNSTVIDLKLIPHIPEEITIIATISSQDMKNSVKENLKISSNNITIGPKSTLVMNFAPEND